MLHSRAVLYFDEVARRGSIRRASEHLNIAASAVDRQILQLECFLGVPLFDRTTKGLVLTAAGEILVDTVRRTNRELSKAISQIDDLQGLRRGEVSIAVVEGALGLISSALAAFRQQYPGVRHKIRVAPSAEVSELVVGNKCDVGLTFNPPSTHALQLQKTLLYKLGVAVAPGHPLTQAMVTVADCDQHPLIVPDDSLSLRAGINALWVRETGAIPYPAFETSNFTLAKNLAAAGCGVALATAVDVMHEIQSKRLKFIPFSEAKAPVSELSLISAHGRSLSIPAALFIKTVEAIMTTAGEA